MLTNKSDTLFKPKRSTCRDIQSKDSDWRVSVAKRDSEHSDVPTFYQIAQEIPHKVSKVGHVFLDEVEVDGGVCGEVLNKHQCSTQKINSCTITSTCGGCTIVQDEPLGVQGVEKIQGCTKHRTKIQGVPKTSEDIIDPKNQRSPPENENPSMTSWGVPEPQAPKIEKTDEIVTTQPKQQQTNGQEKVYSVFGSDVKALYPSIKSESTGKIIRKKWLKKQN